jgi:hypothetical protein
VTRPPFRHLLALSGLFALSLLSCGREVTGPENGSAYGRVADLAFAPQLPGPMAVVDGAGSVVPFDRVRVILRELGGRELLSRVIDFPATATEVPLALEFPLPPNTPETGLPVHLLLRYINAAGDTVFAGGPVQVIARPRDQSQGPQEVPVVLDWVGPGSEAVRVELTPDSGSAMAGTSTNFTAVAYDAQDVVVDAAPVVLSTPDPTIASISAPGASSVTWLAVRGAARVIASLPSGPSDTAFFDVALPASQLLVVSGGDQSAFAGTALAAPVVLRVTAADEVAVEGVAVSFAVATGGGSLDPASAVSDANGDVSVNWTLGDLLGAQTLTATFEGLATPVTVTATAAEIPPAGLRTWTGAADTQWSNTANWLNGLVPTSLDTVLVTAAATFDPALAVTDSVVISGLTVEDGATLDIGDALLVVVGSVTAPVTPSITVGVDGGLGLLGTTGTVGGTFPSLFLGGGAYGLSGALLVDGILTVNNGTLTVSGFPVTVQGDFYTGGTGALAMLPGSEMTVAGDAIFSGGSTAGLLTGGRLSIGGDFVQAGANSPSSFAADAGHETWFTSAAAQGVTFLTPGTGPTLSHFGTLYSSQAAGGSVDLTTDAWADGALVTGVAANVKRFTGTGQRLVSRGANIDAAGIEFDGVRWELLDGAAVTALQAITFLAMDPAVTQWRIARAGGSFTVPGLQFVSTPTTGRFLELEDTSADTDVLTLDVTGVTPAVSGGLVSLLGGAQLIGWPAFAGLTWTGAVSRVWTDPANYVEGFAPASTDSVRIPAAGVVQMPLLTAETIIRALVNENAAPIDIDGAFLIVRGRLALPAGTAGAACVNGGQVEMQGLDGPSVVQGTMDCGMRAGYGSVSLSGATTLTGADGTVWISAGGTLDIGAHTLTTPGTVYTDAAGVLTMTDPAGAVNALGASFGGGPTTGLLTAGTITLSGTFSAHTNPGAFDAGGTHLVRMAGALDTADVQIALPATTQFANLEVARPVRLNGETRVGGSVVVTATGAITGPGPLVVEGALTADPAASILVAELFAGGALTLPTVGLFDVPRVTLTGTGQTVPLDRNFPVLRITGSATAAYAGDHVIQVSDSLVIDGGELRAGLPDSTTFMDVGVLRTQNGGVLRMQDPNTVITVNTAASFAGGSTDGLLTAGQIDIWGVTFAQGGGAPDAYAASPGHSTRFLGGNGHTVSFADPGMGPLTSHFGDLEIALDAEVTAVTLLSDAQASGVLRTGDNFQRRFESAVPRRLLSHGANVSQLEFSNVAWDLRDGSPVTTITGVTFENMSPAAVQFDIARANDTIFVSEIMFATTPELPTGRYLRVTDTDGPTPETFAVTIAGVSPAVHNGFAETLNGAALLGWPELVQFRWTGAVSQDWTNGLNWSDGQVPTAADSVTIPEGPVAPVLPLGGVTVRAFVSERATSGLYLGEVLTVTERLQVPLGNGINCDGGGVDVAAGVGTANIAGLIAYCNVRVLSGTAAAAGDLTVESADLQVEGTALLDVGPHTVTVNGNFSTLVEGRLRMTDAAGALLVSNGASFGGGSTAGLLTAGTLQIGGNFTQAGDYAEGFAASDAHVTRFAGGFTQQASFLNPGTGAGTSHFGNVELAQLEPGIWLQLESAAYAEGVLRTGTGAQQLRKLFSELDPASALFQSRGADVDAMTFTNVKWSILDGAPIGRMDNITFAGLDSAATRLNMERSAGDVTIRAIDFGALPNEGRFLRLFDPDGNAVGIFQVTFDVVTPTNHQNYIILENGALMFGWDP